MEDVSGRNPLEIPEILENILECLPLKDLKSSRLVNKLWRDCGIAPMKKKEKSGVWMGHAATYPDKTIVDVAKFSRCLNSVAGGSADFPCSKFFLSLSLIRCDNGTKTRNKDELVVSDFLQKISPVATELWLSMDLEKKLFMSSFPRKVDFPKLKLLEVSTIGSQLQNPNNSPKKLYKFVTRILEKAPSLQTVDLWDDEHSIDTIIKAQSPSFTELRIYGMTNTSMEKLSKWNREVKLKSLDLRFMYSEVNSTSFFQFLRSQSNSLETLVLYFHFSYVSSPGGFRGMGILSFPEMPKLKNLTIQLFHDDYNFRRYNVTFSEISYQRHFPALKALRLNPENLNGVSLSKQFIKQDMQPVETLDELTLPIGGFDDACVLTTENAVRIFPNLKKLEVMAYSDLLPTVFELWTNLEQLTLYSTGSCIDYMLIGRSRSGYKRIQRRIERKGDDFDWNRLEPGNVAESILNLQKLRVLRFINENESSRELEVTRASLHLIMSRMGSLKCVDFGNRGYPMATKIDKAWWAELNEDCVVLWNHIQ